jgi:hypothetical protein
MDKLLHIDDGLEQFVRILGAQEVPPQLILSPEVNVPRRRKSGPRKI